MINRKTINLFISILLLFQGLLYHAATCPANCNNCIDALNCNICNVGFGLDSGANTCTACSSSNRFSFGSSPCQICTIYCSTTAGTCVSTTGKCNQCIPGFSIDTTTNTCTDCSLINKFSLGTLPCNICTGNCSTAVGTCNSRNGTCSRCQPGFAIISSNNTCQDCSLSNKFSLGLLACAICTVNCASPFCNSMNGICNKCISGFSINNLTNQCINCAPSFRFSLGLLSCAPCTSNCAEVSGSCAAATGICSKCLAGFGLNSTANTCINCSLTNQFSLGTLPCVVCTSNCGSCNAATGVCSKCIPGYSLNSGSNTCIDCSLTGKFSLGLLPCADCTINCKVGACNSTTGLCNECILGYGRNTVTNQCTDCALTNKFSLGILPCALCTPFCLAGSCSATTGICSQCEQGYVIKQQISSSNKRCLSPLSQQTKNQSNVGIIVGVAAGLILGIAIVSYVIAKLYAKVNAMTQINTSEILQQQKSGDISQLKINHFIDQISKRKSFKE